MGQGQQLCQVAWQSWESTWRSRLLALGGEVQEEGGHGIHLTPCNT
jgi:hypothetical protein